MGSLSVIAGSTQNFDTPGTAVFDPVTLGLLSTLNISGAGVNVTLSDISAVAGSTISVSDGASVTLSGLSAGVLNSFVIGTGGTLNAGTVLTAANPISFTGTGGVLMLPEGISLLSPLSGFTAGNEIKTAGTISSYLYTPDLLTPTLGGTLIVTNSDGTSVATSLLGDYSSTGFVIDTDGSLGVACYCRGTLIKTEHGEVPVEDLQAGDRLVTLSGRVQPIKWIGRRSYAGRFLSSNPRVLPIKFSAGSLGGGLPRRDLQVSPDHAMYLDGVLVPARSLVNDSTIQQLPSATRVDYFHIELPAHDVILAEGAASETFLDDDSRNMFHNAEEYARLWPDAMPDMAFCAPRFEDGYVVQSIRSQLAAIAGMLRQAA
jgi:hypothetical protein